MAQKILLVDDDEGYLLAARRILEGAGYEVRTVSSAAEARQSLASESPDLLLLDVIMPAEDGFTFAEALSKDEAVADIPIVLVTAVAESPGQTMRAFGEDKGLSAVDILPKSEVHKRLLETVASALGKGVDETAEQSSA